MLGIAVPSYKYHIPVLKRFLDSVSNQTVKPDFVVVSCSSSLPEDIPKYEYNFRLEFIIHSERLNAAQNRNIAAKRLIELGCEYISFFDCDDEMHPQRIEAIKEGFEKYPLTEFVVHSFWGGEAELEEDFEIYTKFFFLENNLEKDTYNLNCLRIRNNTHNCLHHSQITIRKKLFSNVSFKESKEFERREDSLFCLDCFSLNVNNLYIRNPLSKYYYEGQWYS